MSKSFQRKERGRSAGKRDAKKSGGRHVFERKLAKKKGVIEMKVEGTDVRHVMSASTLIGDKVVNAADEDLGKIEEIMLHVPSGRIAYAVLSFGGFMGMGDKLFAIPWEALKLDEDRKCFVLGIDKERLEKAPGFDKDKWPNRADIEHIYKYYGRRAKR